MPRSLGTAVENNFTGGLVTEATALNFPENAVVDVQNCVISKTGSISRRPGLDYETGATYYPAGIGEQVNNTFLWRNIGGAGDLVVVVLQVGAILHFYKSSSQGLSPNKYAQTVNLNLYRASADLIPEQLECQFAFGRSYLLVVNPAVKPLQIKYDVPTDTFVVNTIDIAVRDTSGIPTDDPIDYRPPSAEANPVFFYNLYNQGWGLDKIQTFRSSVGATPSNADVWWLLKDSYGNFKPGPIESQVAVKDKTVTVYGDLRANSVFRGNTPAPRGHYIISGLLGGRGTVSGLVGLPNDTTAGAQPGSVAFFSGRAFYSGITSVDFTDKIFFSQIIESDPQLGKCYQENDPTSENLFSLLASDGGVIVVPDVGQILKLFAMQGSLLVFATNGIWAISGSTGIGFTATDYSVSKISAINCTSATTFVDIDGYPTFWNEEGIYSVVPGKASGVEVQSLTEKSIKQFFKDIPLQSKKTARGFYNPLDKTVQWLYRSVEPTSLVNTYDYDTILVFNTLIGAFYYWDLNQSDTRNIAGMLVTKGVDIKTTLLQVSTNAGASVTATDSTTVSVSRTNAVPTTYTFKYLVYDANGITFADLKDGTFADFGVAYASSFTTGYRLRGEGSRNSQVENLIVYFEKNYNTTLRVGARWDYTTSGNTGRWTVPQIVYSGYGDQSYDFRKLRIRGHGKAVQFRFESIGSDPFTIAGWVATESVNGVS